MGKRMVGLMRILPLCAVVLVFPAVAAAQPNLQPTGITFDTSTAVVGSTVFFDSGVSNTGDVDTGIFNIKWFVNGQEVGAYGSHAGVPAGQTVMDGNSQFSWTFDSPGTHSVTFTVDVDNHVLESNEGDNAGSVQVTVTEAGQPPEITLLGTDPLQHTQGCPFVGAGATATDTEDGELTHSIIIDGSVDINAPGQYFLTYSITDSSGRKDEATRQVVVFGVIGTPVCFVGGPAGRAPYLIVLVHGCCTNADDVKDDWDSLGRVIAGAIQAPAPEQWEIVVWDWSRFTPKIGEVIDPFGDAYRAAEDQGRDFLAPAIANYPYKHVHLIGHSAGANLIDKRLSRFNLPRPLMPWDTGVYDTYTVIPDSPGSASIYRLIGINSIQ